jgi:clan AA aspartic protease
MWSFVGSTPVIQMRLGNTLLDSKYPKNGGLMAVVDTGFSGFLFVPEHLFKELGFDQLKMRKSKGLLADGSELELQGAYGTVEFPDLAVVADGLVETSPGASELLVGMEGLRQLRLTLDCCAGTIEAEACEAM